MQITLSRQVIFTFGKQIFYKDKNLLNLIHGGLTGTMALKKFLKNKTPLTQKVAENRGKGWKNRWNKQKNSYSKMADLNPTVSVIILSVDHLHTASKEQRLSSKGKKQELFVIHKMATLHIDSSKRMVKTIA